MWLFLFYFFLILLQICYNIITEQSGLEFRKPETAAAGCSSARDPEWKCPVLFTGGTLRQIKEMAHFSLISHLRFVVGLEQPSKRWVQINHFSWHFQNTSGWQKVNVSNVIKGWKQPNQNKYTLNLTSKLGVWFSVQLGVCMFVCVGVCVHACVDVVWDDLDSIAGDSIHTTQQWKAHHTNHSKKNTIKYIRDILYLEIIT